MGGIFRASPERKLETNRGATMKMRILFVLTLALALLALSACQPAAPTSGPQPNNPPAANTQSPQGEAAYPPVETVPELPAGQSAYPGMEALGTVAGIVEDDTYPDIADGSSIDWAKAYGLITRGEVVKVITGDAGQVTLNLKDGRTLTAQMPSPQDLQVALDACQVCEGLEVVRE
jgi:hypothetical protein